MKPLFPRFFSCSRAAACVGIVTFAVRLWFLQKFQDSPFFEPISGGNDRALYDGLAQQIAEGRFFPKGVFEHMPLYPWLLGGVYAAFGPNLYLVGWIGAILDSATAFLMVRLAGRLGAPTPATVFAGLLYAFYPTAIVYSVVTMPNTLNAFCLTLFAFLWVRIREDSRVRPARWFGIGLLAGLTALGFAGMLLVVVACLVHNLISSSSNPRCRLRSSFFNSLCFLFAFTVPILPVAWHNWNAERRWVLITAHGGFNFYMGNHENATGYPVQIGGFRGDAGSLLADARAEAERDLGRKLTAAEFSEYWSSRAWAFIHRHPLEEIQLMSLKFLKFWNHREYDDLRLLPMFQRTDLAFTSPFWPGFGLIACLGLTGLLIARGCGPLRWITLGGITGVLGFFVTARYRLTFAPLLGVLGALGLAEIARCGRERPIVCLWKWGGLGLGAWMAWLPLSQSDFRALDHYNTAAYLLARGIPDRALEQAVRGLAIAPEDPSLHFVGGNALLEMGRAREAVSAYGIVLRFKPNHASAHYNLALAWMKLQQPRKAAREAALALQYDPQHPKAKKLIEEAEQAATKPL